MASYAELTFNNDDVVGGIDSTAGFIFDASREGSVIRSKTSDDITYDSSVGTLQFSRAGTYHVLMNLVTVQASADGLQTVTIGLSQGGNVEGNVYTAYNQIELDYDPIETTHQRIVVVEAGEKLEVKLSTAGGTCGPRLGTTMVVSEITTGDYAHARVVSQGHKNTTAAVHPFMSSSGWSPTNGTSSGGVVYNNTNGRFTCTRDGNYVVSINSINDSAGAGINSNAVVHILKNGASVSYCSQRIGGPNDNNYPIEFTTFCVTTASAADYFSFKYDISNSAPSGCLPEIGTSMGVYRLQDCNDGGGPVGSQRPAACVISEANSASSAAVFNPFGATIYGGSEDFQVLIQEGITWSSADGTFVVDEPGWYNVSQVHRIQSFGGDAEIVVYLKVNNITVNQMHAKVDSAVDPMERTLVSMIYLEAGDSVTGWIDGDVNIKTMLGTTFSIYRTSKYKKDDSTLRSSGSISEDFTINSYSIEALTAQRSRNVDQVPFILGTPGPLSLRGRDKCTSANDVSYRVEVGKKKN